MAPASDPIRHLADLFELLPQADRTHLTLGVLFLRLARETRGWARGERFLLSEMLKAEVARRGTPLRWDLPLRDLAKLRREAE